MFQNQRLQTVADVAEFLQISRSLVYQLIEKNLLPCIRVGVGRGAIRFRNTDIAEYLENCSSQSGDAKPRRNKRPRLKHLHL